MIVFIYKFQEKKQKVSSLYNKRNKYINKSNKIFFQLFLPKNLAQICCYNLDDTKKRIIFVVN